MNQFKPSIEEDLNRLHTVNLTEGQISTILFILEDAVEGEMGNVNCDDDEEDTFMKDIDSIFETLEGVVDAFYSQEKVKKLPCNDLKIIPPNPYVKDSPSLPERY